MWFLQNNFERKSVKDIKVKKKKDIKSIIHLFKWSFSIIIVFLIFYFWNTLSYTLWTYIKDVAWIAVKNISSTLAKEPKKDNIWNVNILLLWVGWKNHDGWYLTDSMMIASFNPKYKSLTFLSVPRDLYVKYDDYHWGRINYIFAKEFLHTRSYDKAAWKLEKKLKEITWVDINYYVLVDFSWFEKLIDELWWVTVDVKEDIVDYRYPWPNRAYQTFKIKKWIRTLDWATALKYARSRHSTSDFARSVRQEQIIKAIIHKLASSWILLDPRKLKALYMQFIDTVKTNFDFNTLLSFVKYTKDVKIHSYSINADCYYMNTNRENLTPWCFVFPAQREDFDWQAVLLPKGSSSLEVDNYKQLQRFVFIALWYPELWLENAKIQILNWISHKTIRSYYKGYLKPIASNLAYDLKNYWFNVVDVKNSQSKLKKTIWYIYTKKPVTEELLKLMVDGINYKTWNVKYKGQWFDITLILWENYLNGIKNK